MLQGAEREHKDQGSLLDAWHLESVDQRHGDDQDEDVGGDAEAGVGEPEEFKIDAIFVRYGLVECRLDGNTL